MTYVGARVANKNKSDGLEAGDFERKTVSKGAHLQITRYFPFEQNRFWKELASRLKD